MASRFWVGGTGTWDASDTTHWAATSNGAGGQSVPVAGDNVTFDALSGGGTVTVNHASLNIATLTWGAFTGTIDFSANDNNITITGGANCFSGTGTGARTFNMGDGTWTFTGNAATFNMLTVTNLTFNANGSTIVFTATTTSARTFTGNSTLTYNNLTISANTSGGSFDFNAATTIGGTFTVVGPNFINFPQSATTTIAALSVQGTVSAPVLLKSSANNTFATVSVASGTPSIVGAGIRDLTCSGGATFTATNSFNLGHNSGITITPPDTGGGGRAIQINNDSVVG